MYTLYMLLSKMSSVFVKKIIEKNLKKEVDKLKKICYNNTTFPMPAIPSAYVCKKFRTFWQTRG